MALDHKEISHFLGLVHPYDTLTPPQIDTLAGQVGARQYGVGEVVYEFGDRLAGLYLIHSGSVEVRDARGQVVSLLTTRNSFGERGLLQTGHAATSAHCLAPGVLLEVPASVFARLLEDHPAIARFFRRGAAPSAQQEQQDLATTPVSALMSAGAITCAPDESAQEAARRMRDARISALCVERDGALCGILSVRDLSAKLVAEGLPGTTPVSALMTPDPFTLPASAIGSDVLHMMMERHISHVPVLEGERLAGIVTQTDLTRFQAMSSAELVADIARATSAAEMAQATAQIPRLLVQLVGGGRRHDVVTRLITDLADTATRRLIALAQSELGPAPVPFLWLACGSQGRQEQTGVSDQDNCLILSDEATPEDIAYFQKLAGYVCDGLNTCGYVYCPGDMMANNPRWCQPLAAWRRYFEGWIATPDPEAQMLASVMFDLRAISGDESLFAGLQAETLEAASHNSIFVGHMIANSVKHTAPLGLLRGIATIRSGEHKNHVDMKHNGVVPVVDLGRVFALRGGLAQANTRARLEAARAAGVLSESGGADLLDAYDLIAQLRLETQARQIRSGGAPDNYLAPAGLSDFERSHLRDAFVVVKTMQSALSHGRGAVH